MIPLLLLCTIQQSVSHPNQSGATHEHSLNAAIRDIKEHPRGRLFQRLIEHGPLLPDSSSSDGTLTDIECGIQFIYSHMVNRFKGELAELLSIEPCLCLMHRLQADRRLPPNAILYTGDDVQERRRTRSGWGSFAKGADGLVVSHAGKALEVHAVIEVKSMRMAVRRVLAQMQRHINRLGGGIRLGNTEWLPEQIKASDIIQIIVQSSSWRLSSEWKSVQTGDARRIDLPEPSAPPAPPRC